MNLLQDLHRERIHWLQQLPASMSAVEVMVRDLLKTAGFEGRAVRVGERAPAFRLPDASGKLVTLEELIEHGPAVLVFYRGHWCPFCTLTLRSYAQAMPRFTALRTSVVAISPQGHKATGQTAALLDSPLPLLSDVGSHVARAYGLAYDLPAVMKELFEGEYATPLPEINSDSQWTLPLAATYVISQQGIVQSAHVDVDFRHREDPETLLQWLIARHEQGDAAEPGV